MSTRFWRALVGIRLLEGGGALKVESECFLECLFFCRGVHDVLGREAHSAT